jgi:glycerate kinase
LRGKVVIGVARTAKKAGVPVIAVVGGAEGDMSLAYEQGVSAVFSINRLPQDFSISRYNSLDNLKFTMENVLRLINVQ